ITLLVNANSLTGTTLAPNVLNSSLTSVGTLTGLTVTNPINGSVTGNAVTWNSRVWVGAGSGQPYMVETDGTNFYGSSLAQVKTDLGLPVSGTYVTSFNSRTGAVIPVAGDYSALTETLTNKSIAATQLTGATLPSNITGSSLTSVGTLSTLSVTGNTKLAGKLLLGGENPLANNGSGSMAPIELVGSGGVGLAASDSGSTTDREAYFAGFLRASGTIARKAGVFAVSPGSLSPGNESFMADIHATKVTAGVGADKFALSFIPGMGMQIFPASRDTLLFPGDSILKVNGYITSLKFTKSGGTPLQFLMADGSTTLTNANILNQTAAQSNANFNISGTSTGSIANTDNIAATGQNSFVAINNATDVGTTLNSGSVIAGNYGELDYTSSSGRTIGASNVTGAGLFLMKPKISGSSTINMTQGSGGLRAMSGLTGIFYMPSTAANTSTISHAAGLRSFLYSDNTSNTYTLTNYYGLLLGTSTEFAPSNVTNRYGIFQEGTSDKNVLNGETTMGSVLKLKGYTVATLPTGSVGAICYVTDATGPVYGATLVGGGSVKTVAFYDGTNWTAH
ncbi:MAG: hypothetical protein Q8L07_04710, partial [Sediminibacterium sp.]|nr:hypothetical protein [Sediminibacterium sp.]